MGSKEDIISGCCPALSQKECNVLSQVPRRINIFSRSELKNGKFELKAEIEVKWDEEVTLIHGKGNGFIPTCSSKLNVEFIIDSFESQMKKSRKLKSHQFTVKDTLWHLVVYPEDVEGYVGVFLANDNKQQVSVSCKFKVGSTSHQFGAMEFNDDYGFKKFFSLKHCKEGLKDGKFELKAEVEILGNDENISILRKGKGLDLNSLNKINSKIFEDRAYTDFNIQCNGKSFPCHKAFLAASSPVFKTMIESKMKEAQDSTLVLGNNKEVVIENFLRFIYTSKMDDEVLKENCVSFLEFGEKYDIDELKATVEQVMIAELDQENMINFFLAGELYHGENIRAAAKTFIRQKRRSLVEQEGWAETLEERPDLFSELCEYFKEPDVHCTLSVLGQTL